MAIGSTLFIGIMDKSMMKCQKPRVNNICAKAGVSGMLYVSNILGGGNFMSRLMLSSAQSLWTTQRLMCRAVSNTPL